MSYCAESFTPDNAFLVGEAPGVKNLFVACGMNSVGIASAAGAGRAIAQLIDQGYPEEQLWPVDVRRYFSWQQNSKYLHDSVIESVGILYEHHYPNRQRTTARPVICSPVHDRLAQNGACFSMVAGWERADWFAPKGVEPVHKYSWGRANWFEYQGEEHKAIREGVGMYDLTSMHKYLVQGPDAEAVLQKLCANDMAVPVGTIVYTPILNERGGFETDFTVTRIAEDTFFIVTAVGTGVRDFDHIKRRIPQDTRAFITDVTHGYTMLALMGPDARKVLSKLTDEDLSNESFPFRTAREIDLGYARVWAFRISYVGELGWELYIPSCFATGVFDSILEAGREFNLRLVGMQAVNSLRMECGYRHWESDITPDDTPYEAGLGFCVKLDKGDFDGRAALVKQKENGITRRLVIFTLEDSETLLGIPLLSTAIRQEISGGKIRCEQTVQDGSIVVEANFPAIMTTQRGLNDPRYPSLSNIMKAKKKPIVTKTLADLGLPSEQGSMKTRIISLAYPPRRNAAKVTIDGGTVEEKAAQLFDLLRNKAGVI